MLIYLRHLKSYSVIFIFRNIKVRLRNYECGFPLTRFFTDSVLILENTGQRHLVF